MALRSRKRQLVLPLLAIAGVVGCVLLALQGSLRSRRAELYAVENLDGSLAALSANDAGGLGGSVSAVGSNPENLQGSLAGFPDDSSETYGSVMASDRHDAVNVDGVLSPQNDADTVNSAGLLAASHQMDVANTQGALAPTAEEKKSVNYHNGQSAISEMDSYFDSLPTHDVTADHAAPKQRLSQPSQAAAAPVHLSSEGFKQARNSDEEWNNKLANMKEAVKLFKTKGDKALEDAVSMGLTTHPVLKGPAEQVTDAESIISQAARQGGVDGYRAKEYAKQVTNLKSGMAKEEKIMQRLNAELTARRKELDEEEQAKTSPDHQQQEQQEKESANKMGDGALNFNPDSEHWKYDEFSDFNPPSSGKPTYTYVPGPNARGNIAEFAHGMSKSLSSLTQAITEKQSELADARQQLIDAKQTINDALAVLDGGNEHEEEEGAEPSAAAQREDEVGQKLALDKKQQQWLGSRPDFEHKNDPHDAWLDYNPHSPAWGYDHHLNKNPTGGEPVRVYVEHDMHGGADSIGDLQRPFQPKKVDVEVPSSFQVDEYLDSVAGTHFKKGSPQALAAVTKQGLTKKMKKDEKALDAAQNELRNAQGTLAALSARELNHHLEQHSEGVAAEIAWDKHDMAVMAHDRQQVVELSHAVDRRQHRLGQDVRAMLALKKHKARTAAARAKAQAQGAAGGGVEAATTTAPALGWLKKHVLAGLKEDRAIPPHVKGQGFTRMRPAGKEGGGQQLAAQPRGLHAGKAESRSLVEAMGVGMCSVLGFACS